MVVTSWHLYPLPFAFRDGGFATAYGHRTHLNNLLLVAETPDGARGFGEICRMAGNTPEPVSPDCIRRTTDLLESLLGLDPANGAEIAARLGSADRAWNNVRAAVETACCDLVSRRAGLPMHTLLGGRSQRGIPTYFCLSQDTPQRMSALIGAQEKHGYHVFQVKLGDPEITRDLARIDAVLERLPRGSTVLADANGGWEQNTAIDAISRYQGISTRFAGDIELLWEEPCNTYEANRKVALATSEPIVLDQCITGPELVAQACNEGLVAGIGIKCTMQGGLQRARLSRDLCIAHGMRMKVDDSWAADVGTSASLHLALAVPPELLICGVDMRPYFEQRVSDEGPRLEGSRFYPSDAPGLGLSPAPSRLGAPLALIS